MGQERLRTHFLPRSSNRKELNKSDGELYTCFDDAYNGDNATFTNPKSLYTYFSLMVGLFDAGKKHG